MNPIPEYLRKIEKALAAGNATEHTYRPALQTLIESMESDIGATNRNGKSAARRTIWSPRQVGPSVISRPKTWGSRSM